MAVNGKTKSFNGQSLKKKIKSKNVFRDRSPSKTKRNNLPLTLNKIHFTENKTFLFLTTLSVLSNK